MNRESIIKRFEKEHRLDDCGNIIETEIAESSLLAEKFTNWLIAVIADLEQENIKLAEDYLTAETQKIIAQEKYDKLKQRIKDAPKHTVIDGYITENYKLTAKKYQGKIVLFALVELPEEMEVK